MASTAQMVSGQGSAGKENPQSRKAKQKREAEALKVVDSIRKKLQSLADVGYCKTETEKYEITLQFVEIEVGKLLKERDESAQALVYALQMKP